MCTNKKIDVVTSSSGIKYCIFTETTETERPFGIYAVMEDDRNDNGSVERIFFTEEEAAACCNWLAENEVFPISLSEVISDLYHL